MTRIVYELTQQEMALLRKFVRIIEIENLRDKQASRPALIDDVLLESIMRIVK